MSLFTFGLGGSGGGGIVYVKETLVSEINNDLESVLEDRESLESVLNLNLVSEIREEQLISVLDETLEAEL